MQSRLRFPRVIQTLWTHGNLSTMERLCLKSYLDNGHEVHLYTYEGVPNVPNGVIIKDGNEIISKDFLDYRTFINNGTFADFFRYKLLYDRGGFWVDTDLICLRPFDFEAEYVFGEMGPWGEWIKEPIKVRPLRSPKRAYCDFPIKEVFIGNPESCISNNCMCAPVGSDIMNVAWEECLKYDPSTIKWSVEVGPGLINKLVKKFSLEKFVLGTYAFNPVDYNKVRDFINPTVIWNFPPTVYAIHLWSDMWNGRTNWKDEQTWQITGCLPILQSKESIVYGSLYGNLVKKYLESDCA